MQQTDVLILGAGAAGLMCALTAARRGRSVLVLDHARQAGEKILISGGGRCNFTNLHCAPGDILFRQSTFLPFGPLPVTRPVISWTWWKPTASPGTKKPSASCFATAPHAPSSPCCWLNAPAPAP